jgi:hypothetical protein
MPPSPSYPVQQSLDDRLAALEKRLASIEDRLGIAPDKHPLPSPQEETQTEPQTSAEGEEEFEFEVGQNWFAKAGVVVIVLGLAFLLTFPYSGLPSALPALFGFALAGGALGLARLWARSFDLLSHYARGSALVLIVFSTLRLFHFGSESAVASQSPAGITILTAALAATFFIALRQNSLRLFGLALVMAYGSILAVDSALFISSASVALSALCTIIVLRRGWQVILLTAIPMSFLTHLAVALNNPLLGHDLRVVLATNVSCLIIILTTIILAAAVLWRRDRTSETPTVVMASGLNGAAALILLLVHAPGEGETGLAAPPLISLSLILLLLATILWIRERSRYSTFLYAMTGYAALSCAILTVSPFPAAFAWLSVQSLVVVATAIWFRSRSIIVMNFVIFLLSLAGYVAGVTTETGSSLVFGIVALASARILHWQQNRLELKTDLMRNAYLITALVAFPYALYHLVPRDYVSLSWVGIAAFYYLMNLIIKAQKYRWMGHLTLLLTVLYVGIVGTIQFSPVYRILSFLVLGTTLVAVSLIFTRIRARQKGEQVPAPDPSKLTTGGTEQAAHQDPKG